MVSESELSYLFGEHVLAVAGSVTYQATGA